MSVVIQSIPKCIKIGIRKIWWQWYFSSSKSMWRTFWVSFACACTNNPWPPLILLYHRVQAKVECFAVCFCTTSAILWPSSAHLFLYGLPPLHFVCRVDSFLLLLSGNRAWPKLSVIRYMYTTHIIQPLIPCYIQHVPVHTCTWNVWQETRDKWTANAAVVVICNLIEAGTRCKFEVIQQSMDCLDFIRSSTRT